MAWLSLVRCWVQSGPPGSHVPVLRRPLEVWAPAWPSPAQPGSHTLTGREGGRGGWPLAEIQTQSFTSSTTTESQWVSGLFWCNILPSAISPLQSGRSTVYWNDISKLWRITDVSNWYVLLNTQHSLLGFYSTISQLSRTNVVTISRDSISAVNEDVVSNQISWNGLTHVTQTEGIGNDGVRHTGCHYSNTN